MWGIGATEMLIVGIVAIILFGSRLPSVARSLGKSLTEFKKGMREFEDEMKSSIYSEPAGRVTYDNSGDASERSATRSESPSDVAEQPAAEAHSQ